MPANGGGGSGGGIDNPIEIDIQAQRAGDAPVITIYHVELKASGRLWSETFGSREQLAAFLRGVEAAYGLNRQFIRIPEVPS